MDVIAWNVQRECSFNAHLMRRRYFAVSYVATGPGIDPAPRSYKLDHCKGGLPVCNSVPPASDVHGRSDQPR